MAVKKKNVSSPIQVLSVSVMRKSLGQLADPASPAALAPASVTFMSTTVLMEEVGSEAPCRKVTRLTAATASSCLHRLPESTSSPSTSLSLAAAAAAAAPPPRTDLGFLAKGFLPGLADWRGGAGGGGRAGGVGGSGGRGFFGLVAIGGILGGSLMLGRTTVGLGSSSFSSSAFGSGRTWVPNFLNLTGMWIIN